MIELVKFKLVLNEDGDLVVKLDYLDPSKWVEIMDGYNPEYENTHLIKLAIEQSIVHIETLNDILENNLIKDHKKSPSLN